MNNRSGASGQTRCDGLRDTENSAANNICRPINIFDVISFKIYYYCDVVWCRRASCAGTAQYDRAIAFESARSRWFVSLWSRGINIRDRWWWCQTCHLFIFIWCWFLALCRLLPSCHRRRHMMKRICICCPLCVVCRSDQIKLPKKRGTKEIVFRARYKFSLL